MDSLQPTPKFVVLEVLDSEGNLIKIKAAGFDPDLHMFPVKTEPAPEPEECEEQVEATEEATEPVEAPVEPVAPPVVEEEAPKNKGGRPFGSKNKKKVSKE